MTSLHTVKSEVKTTKTQTVDALLPCELGILLLLQLPCILLVAEADRDDDAGPRCGGLGRA